MIINLVYFVMAPIKWIHIHIDFGRKMLRKDQMHYNNMCTLYTPYMKWYDKKSVFIVDLIMIKTNKMSEIA